MHFHEAVKVALEAPQFRGLHVVYIRRKGWIDEAYFIIPRESDRVVCDHDGDNLLASQSADLQADDWIVADKDPIAASLENDFDS